MPHRSPDCLPGFIPIGHLMNRPGLIFSVAVLGLAQTVFAQSSIALKTAISEDVSSLGAAGQVVPAVNHPAGPLDASFSAISLGATVSPMGIGVQVTSNLNQHLNLRASGNLFGHSIDFTTSGFTAYARVRFASAGAALDIYPFHTGFRISPGFLFYNQNKVTASDVITGGTSFTLNEFTYYSARANQATGATPVNGNAVLGLDAINPAFTITAGWGNTIPRKGHWSFPVEVGVALVGAPTLNVNLGGWACYDQAETLCTNISSKTDPIAIQIQDNLQAQIAKWKRDLDPLKTYPILSFGVAYSFRIR